MAQRNVGCVSGENAENQLYGGDGLRQADGNPITAHPACLAAPIADIEDAPPQLSVAYGAFARTQRDPIFLGRLITEDGRQQRGESRRGDHFPRCPDCRWRAIMSSCTSDV